MGEGTGCIGSLNLPLLFLARYPGPQLCLAPPSADPELRPLQRANLCSSGDGGRGVVSSSMRGGNGSRGLTASQKLSPSFRCTYQPIQPIPGGLEAQLPSFSWILWWKPVDDQPSPLPGRATRSVNPSCFHNYVAVVSPPGLSVLGDL